MEVKFFASVKFVWGRKERKKERKKRIVNASMGWSYIRAEGVHFQDYSPS